ncbi:MAG: 16S rRNA (cytosine(1402)-N(4))-methyltransferase RsmH [Dysgonamonadaceae bacterium]|jgi:16S rRNA (cytosine1402-N4)-methyltransferase|nr:16S rRNA (cytosine(1402)-N(4))-methyltransferase RsmH [Dysgonamonadaceae bacterium]
MNETVPYHVPVLLQESVAALNIRPEGIYVDATFGGGGHAKEIIGFLGDTGRLYGFDQDEDAEKNILPDKRFVFVRSNFRYLTSFMDWYGIKAIDGLIADLGVSSHHFDDETRGFSFRFTGDLDMRMNKRAGQTAAELLNTYSEESLADVFYLYGELRKARAIAKAIVQARKDRKIHHTQDFLNILKPFFSRELHSNRPGQKEKKQLAQAFQALRIEVNGEMEALKEMLMQAGELLRPGGRMVVITYHSLEDRLVKNFFKAGNFEGVIEKDFYGNIHSPFQAVNNKAIVPDEAEIERNPRSRSAKLRIVEKL